VFVQQPPALGRIHARADDDPGARSDRSRRARQRDQYAARQTGLVGLVQNLRRAVVGRGLEHHRLVPGRPDMADQRVVHVVHPLGVVLYPVGPHGRHGRVAPRLHPVIGGEIEKGVVDLVQPHPGQTPRQHAPARLRIPFGQQPGEMLAERQVSGRHDRSPRRTLTHTLGLINPETL
jgi:hypothetical protein